MCIYCGTTKYRKIYKNHYGLIPIDTAGRTYDIHHIDGNHSNNYPDNLESLSIQEHYDIHYSHGDWAACSLILHRMSLSPEEISKLASILSINRVNDGTHPFLGGNIQRASNKLRIDNGTHNFLDGTKSSETQRALVKNGTHHLLGGKIQKKAQQELVKNGTHHLLGNSVQRKLGPNPKLSAVHKNKLADRTHSFLEKATCPHCGLHGQRTNLLRWHFDKCKHLK